MELLDRTTNILILGNQLRQCQTKENHIPTTRLGEQDATDRQGEHDKIQGQVDAGSP